MRPTGSADALAKDDDQLNAELNYTNTCPQTAVVTITACAELRQAGSQFPTS